LERIESKSSTQVIAKGVPTLQQILPDGFNRLTESVLHAESDSSFSNCLFSSPSKILEKAPILGDKEFPCKREGLVAAAR
jgi:hypothetical protein